MIKNKVVCPHCDLVLKAKLIKTGQTANCPRCHEALYYDNASFSSSIALLLAALFLYFPSILLPFLDMTISSREQKISLLQSVEIVYQEESYFLALAIFLLILFAPIVRITGMLLIILPKHFNKKPIFNKKMIRFIAKISPWNMVEVYLFAVVVTLIKISSLAIIHTSQGFFAFVFFIIINTFISYLLPSKRIWQML